MTVAGQRPCDSCYDAASEEGTGYGLDSDDLQELMGVFGDELADHLCDEIETEGEIRCGCDCKGASKRKLRKGKERA